MREYWESIWFKIGLWSDLVTPVAGACITVLICAGLFGIAVWGWMQ